MASTDSDYYAQRAREERAKAAETPDPEIAAIHMDLAINS